MPKKTMRDWLPLANSNPLQLHLGRFGTPSATYLRERPVAGYAVAAQILPRVVKIDWHLRTVRDVM